jgi:hypothetical protein
MLELIIFLLFVLWLFLEMLGFHIDTSKTLQIEDAEVYRFYMQGR